MNLYRLSYLKELESESIFIMREAAAEFKNLVMLYSVGKDSSVMVRLAQKAFYPGRIPFPLMHVDTGYKFPEMYEFRDWFCKEIGAELIVERNEDWITKGCHPFNMGVDKCCEQLKTLGLLNAIKKHGFDAAFGGARRDEEKSRAKERVFSLRDKYGQWDPKNQRPELWALYNTCIDEEQSVRVFPLSNWTEHDVWQYIKLENIPVVPLYFAKQRKIIRKKDKLIPVLDDSYNNNTDPVIENHLIETVLCRFRTLGCMPCTGAVESASTTLDDIIKEVAGLKKSERENRLIDNTGDFAMEGKKKKGYF